MRVPLLKQSDGKASASFTMMVVSFAIVSFWLVISIFETVLGVPIREFDSGSAMAYFTPIAALYFTRRLTDAHYTSAASNSSKKSDEEETTPAP